MKDKYDRKWIIENSLEEIENYENGVLTIRGLHYRLVARGMTNTIQHYKRVVSAMVKIRWDNLIDFEVFSDNDRDTIRETDFLKTTVEDSVYETKDTIKFWLDYYQKNRWENQNYYPEVFIEKKALQGVFSVPCKKMNVALSPCKGYPSLTFLYAASKRFKEAIVANKIPIILYFGDYDPSGEDIPRSIRENLYKMGVDLEVRVVSLLESQVLEWGLPPAPAKKTDSRTSNWQGLGQVELDAVEPKKLQELCTNSINNIFDKESFLELKKIEAKEKIQYKNILKDYINNQPIND